MEPTMNTDKSEAENCYKLATESLRNKQFDKALKLAKRAANLCQSPQYDKLIAQIVKKKSENESNIKLINDILSTEDYYKILNVSKTATEEEIKKAYKKRALILHPDKNSLPGAEEAFKKISVACQCLTDSDKRRHYEQTGQTNPRDFNPTVITPEQLFEAFFGIDVRRMNTRSSHVNFTYSRNRTPTNFSHYVPLLIISSLILLSNFMMQPSKPYSTEPTHKFSNSIKTQVGGVNYFVDPKSFDREYPVNSPQRIRLEYEVDYDYFDNKCYIQNQQRQRALARYAFTTPPSHLLELPESCKLLRSLNEKYQKIAVRF